jgi:hypothetical protein
MINCNANICAGVAVEQDDAFVGDASLDQMGKTLG